MTTHALLMGMPLCNKLLCNTDITYFRAIRMQANQPNPDFALGLLLWLAPKNEPPLTQEIHRLQPGESHTR